MYQKQRNRPYPLSAPPLGDGSTRAPEVRSGDCRAGGSVARWTFRETRYARSGDLQIAYQVLGDGPLDVVFVPLFVSNIDVMWEVPDVARMLRRIASFSRLIVFDRRGSGMSDGTPGVASLEEQIDDVRAVLDAVGAEQPALISIDGGLRAVGAVRGLASGRGARARDDDADAARWCGDRATSGRRPPRSAPRASRPSSSTGAAIHRENPMTALGRSTTSRAGARLRDMQRLSMSPGAAAAAQRDGRRGRRAPRAAEHPVPDTRPAPRAATRSSTSATRATSPTTSRTRGTSSSPATARSGSATSTAPPTRSSSS